MEKSDEAHAYIKSKWGPYGITWIGVNDLTQEGTYKFADGSAVLTSYHPRRKYTFT